YKNTNVWLTSVALIFFTLVSNGFSVYVVRFLMLKGMDRPVAASTYSWMTILGTASMLVIGFLADKLGTKRKIAIVGFLVCSLAMFLLAKLPVNLIFIYVILFGTFPRGTVGLTNAAASDLAEVPSDVPIVTSLKNTILQIGNVLGGIALGYLIQFKGYEFTSCMLGIGCIIGAVCWFFAKKVK
ncbi:MAG: MFS transporter, partial [Lachnospiraceae bacterium]|nr:MFS transporter [Lachnospiraceae bacterium]